MYIIPMDQFGAGYTFERFIDELPVENGEFDVGDLAPCYLSDHNGGMLKLYRLRVFCQNVFCRGRGPMKVNVLFFGATADAVGKRRLVITVAEDSPAQAVFDQVMEEYPGLKSHKLLFSVNQEYARGEALVRDGDELAVFTAVS